MNIFYPLLLLLMLLFPVINLTFHVKFDKKLLFIYSVILYLLIHVLYIYDDSAFSISFMLISIFLYFVIIYRQIFISLALSVIVGFCILISDAVTGFMFINILNYEYDVLINNPILYFILGIVILINCYIFSRIIRIIVLKVLAIRNFQYKYSKSSNFISITAIFVIIFFFIFYLYVSLLRNSLQTLDKATTYTYAVFLVLFFLSIVAVLYYCFSIVTTEHKYSEYLQLKEYTDIIENMYSDLRSFKHDYLNILSILATYIDNDDMKSLKDFYYNDLLPESSIIMNKDTSLSLLSHIKISPLKSLLSSKIVNAHSKSIDVKIEIVDDIEAINMSTIDICRIIGILFDNAIDGSVLCDYKFIHFVVLNVDNKTIFIINNSCLESTPPVYKVFEKNFSTKGKDRGIGLNNVKELIDKSYKNVLLNTKIENCTFNQELIIYNKKKTV